MLQYCCHTVPKIYETNFFIVKFTFNLNQVVDITLSKIRQSRSTELSHLNKVSKDKENNE